MDYQGLINGFNKWKGAFKEVMLREEVVGTEPWTTLYEELESLISMLDDPDIAAPLDTMAVERVDRIDSMGIGSTIISLYKSGAGYEEIANNLSLHSGVELTPVEIKNWISSYNASSITGRSKMVRGSVFETRFRLEEMHLLIHRHLENIEATEDEIFRGAKTTKVQVLTEAYRELRQLYKDANALVTAIQQLNTVKEFQEVVLEVISKVSPTAYRQIVKELKERKVLMNSLLP